MTEQTKAEQLANMPMEDRGLIWICESELELRRLSQREAQNLKLMDDLFLARAQLKEREAERDKLLAVNKVLVDALTEIASPTQTGGLLWWQTRAQEALKLAGEIK